MPESSSIEANTILLFVYGTLRKGCSNHHFLSQSSFLGLARTENNHALYMGDFPYAAKKPEISPIVGEVYAVDLNTLQLVDSLEEHPNWYRREQVRVRLESGESITAWLYFHPSPKGDCVESGDIFQA